MKPSVVIVGSAGIDMVIKTDNLPAPGETVSGGTFFMNPGGKGANQAVAAARLNGKVIFIRKNLKIRSSVICLTAPVRFMYY